MKNQNNSVLSETAKFVGPIFKPLGVEEDNWPATVGLITGLLAKEVVVGALDALYQNMDVDRSKPSPETMPVGEAPAPTYDLFL